MHRMILFWAVLASATAWAEPYLQMTSAPSSVQSGTSYYIEASCNDNMGGVSVTIYKNNSYFASSYGTSPVYVGGSTTDYGAQTVVYRIEAVNDFNQTDTIYHYVTITQPNNAPTIQWVTTPGSVPINQAFTVQAKGMDQDGNLTNVFVWREWTPFAFNGGGNGYENTSDGNTYSQGSAGTVTFQAQAQDSNGATSAVISHSVSIYVPNQAPTITWINYPASAYVNQSFNVQARGDDANGNLAWVHVWKNGSPFAFNGGGNGYQGYSDNNAATGTAPGTVQFSAQSGDSASATSATIYHNVTINNRAPNTPSITASGAGVTDMGNGQFSLYNEPPNNQITISSTMSDPDANLANHTIYYQQVTGANPDPGGWVALTNGTPSNAGNSTVSTTQTMLTPGRWDFHVNGHDGYLGTGGASLTVYVYGFANGATFVSQNVNGAANPSSFTVSPGQTFPVSITLRNTGAKPWNSDATPHRLGAVYDVTTWGLTRVALPVSVVNPLPQSGNEVTFTFTATAPVAAGNHTFQWQMVEDGITWFGDATPAVTVTVSNVAPTASLSLDRSTANVGDTVTATLTVADPNGNLDYTNLWVHTPALGWRWIHADNSLATGGSLDRSHSATAYGASGTFTRAFSVTLDQGIGTYTFSLAAVDASGTRTDATSQTVTVSNRAPTISASVTPATIVFGQSVNVSFTAGDPDGNLLASGVLTDPTNTGGSNYRRPAGIDYSPMAWTEYATDPGIWTDLNFGTAAASGSTNTKTGVYRPDRASAAFLFTIYARDDFGIYTGSWTLITVTKATPSATFASRTLTATGTIYTVQAADLNAIFTNPYSGAVASPTGSVTYMLVGPNTAVTAGTQLAAGQAHTLRAAYGGDGNYNPTTQDAIFTIASDPNADDDSDGLPNGWESANGLNPSDPNDGLVDSDGDGLTNVAEFNLDKNPQSRDVGTSTLGGSIPAGWPNSPGASTYAVGLTAGSLAVDKQGAASYAIPLWAVPGTAGMQPQLALNYSSQAGAGWLGFGWSLSGLSAISRGPQTKATDDNVTGISLTSADRFYLDGQRLIAISGTYGANGTEYRTEIDAISKVVSYGTVGSGPGWFRIWTKAGLIIELGNTVDSAAEAQGRSDILTWAVNRISDTKGNYMDFVYTEDTNTGEQRIARINYTGNTGAALTPYASVRFTYESRTDTFAGYVAGSKVARSQRIKTIAAYYGETKVREYTLDYTERANTGRSLLTALHEKAPADNREYPPLTFEYDEAPATGIWDQSQSTTWAPPAIMGEQGQQPKGTGFVDLNGDGRPDFVQAHQNAAGQWLDGGPQAWINNPTSGWVSAPGYNPPAPLAKDGSVGSFARFVDLNGDGLVDFINLINGYAYLNTPGTGWAYSADWSFPMSSLSLSQSAAEQALKDVLFDDNNPLNAVTVTNVTVEGSSNGNFVDVNGDGRLDFVGGFTTYKVDGTGNNGKATMGAGGSDPAIPYAPYLEQDGWRNTGSGWARETAYGGGLGSIQGARLVDVNADGLLDSVQKWYGSGTTLTHLYLGNGAGWTNMGTSHALIPPVLLNAGTTGNDNAPVGTEMADLNGDGLNDLISRNDSSGTSLNSAYLGTGTGWVSASAYLSPLELTHDNTPQGVALLDLNADGLVDLVQGLDSYTRAVRFGTGNGWSSDVTAYHLVRQIFQPNIGYNGTDFVDLNADGAIDQVWHWKPTSGSAVSGVALNNAKPADRLKKVTNGFGVAAQLTYAPLTERDGSGGFTVYDKGTAGPADTANVIGPMYVVKAVSHDDGAGGQYAVNYRYGGLRSHRLRGSLGFEWTQATDSRTGIVSKTTYRQEYPNIGLVASTETKSGATVLSASTITYADKNATGAVRLPYASVVTQASNDLNGAAIAASTTTTQIDAYGNATSIVVDTGDGYTKTTTNSYTDSVSLWLLGRLTNSTVAAAASGKPTITRTSSFAYHATTGLLETETVEPNDNTLKVTTTYGHDAFGNRTSVAVSGLAIAVDAGGNLSTGGAVTRTTVTAYDSQGRFPISTTNALGHTETYDDYDQSLGVLKAMTGANDLTTSWTYDSFGVKTRETRADGTITDYRLRWAGSGAPAGSHTFLETESTGAAPSLVFNDSFGRPLYSLAINGDGRIVYQQTAFDNMGRAYARTNPYFGGDPVYWTQTTSFDALNRPLSVNTPDDSVSYVTTGYSYNGRVTTVTDPLNRVARSTVNSQGWLIEAVRNNNSGGTERSVVTHDYDALGNLTSTVADGVTTSLAYDLRGRKTSMVDPDMGTWQYRYNVFGELIWQKDAKNQIVTLGYDLLGRLTSRVEAEGTTTWTYDTSPTKGLGKLHTVSAPGSYGETHTYDSLGRPARVARTIDGTTYEVDASYDTAGRVLKTTYPTVNGARFATRQVYNAFGYLKEIRNYLTTDDGLPNDQLHGYVYWMADHYAVTGQVDGEVYGNGLANDRVYSARTGRLLGASIDKGRVTAPPYALQQLVYTHDAVGNVVTRADQAVGRGESFAYDGLDRLTAHTIVTGSGTSVSATYDTKGNIASKSNVGAYSYGSGAGPHAVTGVSGGPLGTQTYTYDANGNMTGGYGRTITWTSFNQAASITQGGYSSTFSFGADHERVKHVSHLETTIYVGALFEKVTPSGGGTVAYKHYVLAPTGRVAVYTDRSNLVRDVRYFHTDGLGSVTAVTDEKGAVVKRFAFDAWGKRIDPATGATITGAAAGGFRRGFTDHEQLDDLGLVHMNGRVYDPLLGRFLSADPFIDGVTDGQSFNRYSYLNNDPLGGVDPSGYFKLKEVLPAVVGIVVAAVVIVTQQWHLMANPSFWGALKAGLGTSAAIWGGAAGGFASGFSGSLLNGGSIGDAFKNGITGAIVGAATAWAAGQIGQYFDELGGAWAEGTFGNWGGRTAAHALVGGLASEAQGGQFRHGFYSSFASAGIMHTPGVARFLGGTKDGIWIAARTTVAATIGGTASVLAGGKFANGAVTSAFQHLFNAEATRKEVSPDEFLKGKRDGFYPRGAKARAMAYYGEYAEGRAVTDTTFNSQVANSYIGDADFVFISSHGSGDAISFQDAFEVPLTVDHPVWARLVAKMKQGAALVLDSCSSANELAPALAQRYKVRVYASSDLIRFQPSNGTLKWMNEITGKPATWYRFDPSE